MGDHFVMLVDEDVTLEEAPDVSRRVIEKFHEMGLILGEAYADRVLHGEGFPPGPAIPSLYKLSERESGFWGGRMERRGD